MPALPSLWTVHSKALFGAPRGSGCRAWRGRAGAAPWPRRPPGRSVAAAGVGGPSPVSEARALQQRLQKEHQKQINAKLCAARSAQEVLAVLGAHSCEEMGDLNVVTAFHRLAKHAGSCRARAEVLASPHLPRLLAYLERGDMQWSAMGVANVCWAHAVLGHGSRALINKAFRQLDLITADDSAHCFATLVQAMARLGRPHAGYLRRLSAALAEEEAQRAQHAQQWGQQRSGQQKGGAMAALLEVPGSGASSSDSGSSGGSSSSSGGGALPPQGQLLGRLNSQQLCLLVYSLAGLGGSASRALQLCLDEVARRDLGSLSPPSLCQVTRALAGREEYHPGACDAVAAAAARLPDSKLDGETCSRLLHDYGLIYQKHLVGQGHDPSQRLIWQAAVRSLVREGPPRRAMLGRVAQRAQQEVATMGAVSLSSLVWGLATLGQREAPLLEAIAARAMQLGTQLDAQAVASICWAFAALSHDHPAMMERLAETAHALLSDPERRGEFSAQTVPMLVLSYAVLNRCDSAPARSMLGALAGRAEEILPELTPQGLSNLGWGLAVARAFPPSLARAWRSAVAECLPQCGPLELNQLHQVEVALKLECPGILQPAAVDGKSSPAEQPFSSLLDTLYQSGRLRSVAKRGWEREQQWGARTVTRWQQKIFRMLRALGADCQLEYMADGGEYSVDIAIPAHRIAVECDGPSHFMSNSWHVEGGTALKHRLLEQLGWRVATVAFFDWPTTRPEQERFLLRLLSEAGLKLEPREGRQAGEAPSAGRQQGQQQRQGMGRPASLLARPAGDAAAAGGEEAEEGASSPSNGPAAVPAGKAGSAAAGHPAGAELAALAPAPEADASNGAEAGKGGERTKHTVATEGPAGQPAEDGAGDSGSSSSSSTGSVDIAERSRRLTVLQYKAGKLSRAQLVARQGMLGAAGGKQGELPPAHSPDSSGA